MVTENSQKSNIDFDDLNQFGCEFASKEDLAKFLQYKEQFKEYYFLNLSGKPAILKMYTGEEGLKYEYSSIYDFKQFHVEEHFMVEGRKYPEKRYFADQWLEDPALRTRYEKCVFDPSGKDLGDKIFNFWTGFVEPKKGDVSVFLNHIDMLIDGTTEQKEHLVKLIAHQIRFPHVQSGTSIALRGPQGAGKTTISMCIAAMCPNHCKVVDDTEDLFGFNSETLHTKYFFMEEAVWGGNKSSEGKLKNAITADTRAIKIKNLTGTTIKNYAFYIFTSNEDWMVPVGPGDRRFNVFDCTSKLEATPGYFEKFYEWLHGEGKHALLHYFLYEIDLEGFNPKKAIDTKAKTDLKTLSLKPVEKFIYNLLSSEIDYQPLLTDGWEEEVRLTRADLYSFFLENTSTNRVEQGEFSRKLASIFDFVPNWKDNWKDRKNGGFYKLPSKAECRTMFAKFLKEDPAMLFPVEEVVLASETAPGSDSQHVEKKLCPAIVAAPVEAVKAVVANQVEAKPAEVIQTIKTELQKAKEKEWVATVAKPKPEKKKYSAKLAFVKNKGSEVIQGNAT